MKNLCVVELNENRKGTRSNKAIPFPAFSCAATASNGHIDCYHMAVSYRFWVTVLTPLLTARAVAVEDGSAHARWLGRRWVGGWFFGGCSRRRLSRREGTAAQATALVGSCGAGRFARAAAMRRPA